MSLCSQCKDIGMCCRYIELPLARPLSEDETKWVELHDGLSMKTNQVLRFEIACSALDDEGLCSLYGTAARPQMCDEWPNDPQNQAPEGCAYLATLDVVAL